MIQDVVLSETQRFVDERGCLTQIFEEKRGLPSVKRFYIVNNFSTNTIRAYHKNVMEWKYFFVIKGAAKFVLVDDREESKTYKEMQEVVLSEDKPVVLAVPPEVYNGWKPLVEGTILLGTADTVLSDHKDTRVPPNYFGDVWNVENK